MPIQCRTLKKFTAFINFILKLGIARLEKKDTNFMVLIHME